MRYLCHGRQMERNKSDGLNNNILQSFWVFFPWPMPFFKGNNP